MKRYIMSACLLMLLVTGLAIAGDPGQVQILNGYGLEPSTAAFQEFNKAVITGDWQQYGQLFISWRTTLVGKIYLFILTAIPLIFFLHFMAIGPKKFSHDGSEVLFFGAFCRLIHWIAAFSFTLLVVTGLMTIFGKVLGGGALVSSGRSIHIISALIFSFSAVFMFLIWLKDMLPMPHDIAWLFIMGGYLSKAKKPVPAAKFNAGQKMWFWMATLGGAVMAATGYIMFAYEMQVDTLRISTIIHSALGAGLVAFFLTHLYMSLFAIKGSLTSMITGYKPEDEVKILHSRYKY